MKKLMLLLLSLTSLMMGQTWELATLEPYNIKYTAVDDNGYVYSIAECGEEEELGIYRYNPDSSKWSLLSRRIAKNSEVGLYIANNGNVILNVKAYAGGGYNIQSVISTDRGENWELSGLDSDLSKISVKGSNMLTKKNVSFDNGLTWEENSLRWKNGNTYFDDYFLVNEGAVIINGTEIFLFPDLRDTTYIKINNNVDGKWLYDGLFAVDYKGNLVYYGNNMICEMVNGKWYMVDNTTDNINMPIIQMMAGNVIMTNFGEILKYEIVDTVLGAIGYESIAPYNSGYFNLSTCPKMNYAVINGKNKISFVNNDNYTFYSMNKGIPAGTVSSMASGQNGIMYVGTNSGEGIFESSDGKNWTLKFKGLYTSNVDILFTSEDNLFWGRKADYMWKYAVPNEKVGILIRAYSVSDKTILMADGWDNGLDKNVIISKNAGDTFDTLFTFSKDINSTAVYAGENEYAIAYNNNEVLLTNDEMRENGVVTTTPYTINSIISDRIGNLYGGSEDGVLKLERNTPSGKILKLSSDTDWKQSGLDGKKINTVYADYTETTDVIYAGTEDGIYYSTDRGVNWLPYNNAPESNAVAKLSSVPKNVIGFSVNGNYVFANVDNTLYKAKRIAHTIGVEPESDGNVAASFELMQNYPNPFNPSTTIRYNLVNSGKVSLKVYNVLGQKVATLVNGFEDAGIKEVKFDGTGLSSGIYIYRIESSGLNTIKKMLLLK